MTYVWQQTGVYCKCNDKSKSWATITLCAKRDLAC